MANWWDTLASGYNNFTSQASSQAPAMLANLGLGISRLNPFTAPSALVGTQVFGKEPNYNRTIPGPKGPATLVPQNLEAAGRMGGANAPASQQSGGPIGMTDEEMLAWLLGGGGSAAPDLSGYNTMIGDVNKRRDALNIRKWQQRKFLKDLFDAAESRAISDRDALAAAVEGQLASDSARRQTEMGLIRTDDAGRLATANAAREALGVAAPQADVASEVAQNAVAGVGSAGAVSDRDARINQAIQAQQFNAEIAGLAPMEQMATGQLMNTYEDRLAALAGERAAIQAQIAQARAAARGSGPSVRDKLAALEFLQGEAPEMPAASGGQAILQSFAANDQANAGTYARIYNSIAPLLGSYAMSTGTGRMMDATELANVITKDNPGLINSGAARDFLQQLVKDYLG